MPGHLGMSSAAFRSEYDVGSRKQIPFEALSRGSHASCVRFAAGVTPGPRNTRFRLVANLYRVRTLTCWVTQEVSVNQHPIT